MKSKFTVFILLLINSNLFSQSSNTQLRSRENESPRYKETYYVLKSDTSIKHGIYKRTGYENETILSGNYKNGLKDSLWLEYLRFSKTIINKGYYSKGQKVGVWEYFNADGTIALKYDYNSNTKVYSEKENTGNVNETYVKNDTGFISVRLQREPYFNGDETQLWKFIKTSIKSPITITDKETKVTVFVSFLIDDNGLTSNHKIVKGINPMYDAEALEIARKIPNDWVPAIFNGKNVSSIYQLPIRFSSK
jgi:protein TonB